MGGPDLHMITFAVPYPATYGGAIDVWNKVRALNAAGVRITLHCFVYGSFNPHDALKEVAKEVHYYPRITWPALLAPGQPYIVTSRKNPVLLSRLMKDKAPILCEGVHTTGFVDELNGRKVLLRSHNIEHQYYAELARDSQRFQYLFFQREALALERYECNKASSFDTVFAISTTDDQWYRQKGAKSIFVPVFHGFNHTSIAEGHGKYLLYQGDLSIELNQKALLELLKNIPREEQYQMVIAGRPGESSFEDKLLKYPNIKREANVSEGRMAELIRDAHIILIHSRGPSGMKVKIFPALYQGRFVVAGENSLTHTNLDKALHIYDDIADLGPLLKRLWVLDFTASEIESRKAILSQFPSDQEKAQEIIRNL